jgi:epoxyqueuosine reductase
MNELIKKMFQKKTKNTPMYFEALTGQLGQLLKRNDIVRHGENSVKQNGFIGSPMETLPLFKKITMLPTGLRLYQQIKKSLTFQTNKPFKEEISDIEFSKFKAFLDSLNITSYGFTKVNRDNIFIDRGILYDNAIVISIQMPLEKIAKAPSFETMVMIEDTYLQTGEIVNKITDFLRKNGFGAHAGPGLGGMTNYPMLAKDANMGEFGRHGLLISPQSGASHRLAAVYTNITNFPYGNTNKHQWIKEYCKNCGICIKKCPNNAILETPKITINTRVRHIEYDMCMSCFNQNFGCSMCVKVCPFTKSGYNKLHEVHLKKQNRILN